jgi:P-type conjugative transfer protein TrbG
LPLIAGGDNQGSEGSLAGYQRKRDRLPLQRRDDSPHLWFRRRSEKMRRTAIVRSLSALSAAALIAAGASAAARAAAAPSTVMPDGSIRYDYGRRPGPVLVCKPQHVCDIVLDSGETVLNMAIGDATHWVIAGGRSGPNGATPHVFVKPTQANLETNLLVTTTKRTYDVDLRSSKDANHPILSFFYTDEDAAAKAAADRAAVDSVLAGNPLVGPDKADAKYKVTRDAALTPDKVFNDGVRTFIVWKTVPVDLPSVVTIDAKNVAQPVNFRLVGSTYIIDGMNPSYDLVLAASGDRRHERRVSIRHE